MNRLCRRKRLRGHAVGMVAMLTHRRRTPSLTRTTAVTGLSGLSILITTVLLLAPTAVTAQAPAFSFAPSGPQLVALLGVAYLAVSNPICTFHNFGRLAEGRPGRRGGMYGIVTGTISVAAGSLALAYGNETGFGSYFTITGAITTVVGIVTYREAGENARARRIDPLSSTRGFRAGFVPDGDGGKWVMGYAVSW